MSRSIIIQMKKLFLLCLVSVFFSYGYAQQGVGIGTTSPSSSAVLELSSISKRLLVPRMNTIQRNAIVGVPGLVVYDTDTREFYHHDGATWRKIVNSTIWNSSNTRNYVFNSSDSIGLGTSTPVEKLHVLSGKIYVQDNRVNQSPHVIFDAPAVDYKEGGLQWKRLGDTMAALNYVANPLAANYLKLSVSNNGKGADMVVNANGNTGLGYLDPLVKLHIRDAAANEVLRLEATNPMIQFRRNISLANYEDVGFVQTSGQNLRVGTNSANVTGQFVVRTGGADRLFVDGSGNVSINTQVVAPGYMLRIGGKVICEEVKVKLVGNWPDYVFADQYKLKPLAELEKFIQSNKHLPNIPSAADLEAEGVELGDMQKKMMEKIEELTLYILQMNKEMENLKLQVAAKQKS